MTPTELPESGSIHHFALLYSPIATRAACVALLGIEREIRASLLVGLDHGVAHVRLSWWQEECARTLTRKPSHPLTRAVCAAIEAAGAGPDLGPLVHAAAMDLAHTPLPDAEACRSYGSASTGTLFRAWAQILAANEQQHSAAFELGTALGSLQCQQSSVIDWQALQRQVAELDMSTQRRLRPLCVWVALACRRTRQGDAAAVARASTSWRELLTQTVVAWRVARAADHGRFKLM